MNGIEVPLYTILASAIGIIALIGGTIWYMQKHFLGRTERELDALERRYFTLVVRGYLVRLISDRIQNPENNRIAAQIQISRDEIDRIKEIFINREDFRIARENITNAKKSIFKYYFSFLLVFLTTMITYFFFATEEELWQFLAVISFILFILLILDVLNYKDALIELEVKINSLNEDLMTEISMRSERFR